MRRTRGLALALVGAVVGLAVTPVIAVAATAPVVNWASSVDDDLGRLEVSASAEAGVTSLKAHIIDYATQQDVAVVDDFDLVSGTVQDGVWQTPEPIQLDRFTGYKVVVDVTDADGVTASGPAFGSLAYLVKTSFSPLRLTPSTLTYAQRSVQVSGTLTGVRPDNRQTVPVPGVVVDVVGSSAEGQPVETTTAADGSFELTMTLTGPGYLYAEFGAVEPEYIRAVSDFTPISVEPAASKVTAAARPAKVDAGKPITVSGTLTWHSPTGWLPLADRSVSAEFCVTEDYCPGYDDPVRTDANGHYELTLTPYETGFYRIIAYSEDPFVASAHNQVDVVVWQPASFSDFTAARDETGQVVVQGHMQFGNFTPSPVPVQIQYKAAGGTWTTVSTVDDAYWDGSGYGFSVAVDQPAAGSWRAYFAGQENFYKATASTAVRVR